MCDSMSMLINAPVYKHHQSEATELPGQRCRCLHVKVSSFRVGEQKQLGSELVKHREGPECGRVCINLRLAANTSKSLSNCFWGFRC